MPERKRLNATYKCISFSLAFIHTVETNETGILVLFLFVHHRIIAFPLIAAAYKRSVFARALFDSLMLQVKYLCSVRTTHLQRLHCLTDISVCAHMAL